MMGFFSAAVKQSREKQELQLPSARVYPPSFALCSARLCRSSRRAKVADGASDEREPSDKVYGTVDAPARFKPDVWKRLGFPVKKSKKVATRQKQYADTV